MEIDRRAMIGAIAVLGAATRHVSASASIGTNLLFARSPLRHNKIAAKVERFSMTLPEIGVLTSRGTSTLREVGKQQGFLSLWAAWCVPCLVEIKDFARLRSAFKSDEFDITLLTTASGKAFDRAEAERRLRALNASDMPLLIEAGGGGRAAIDLATPHGDKGFSLPCTLLIDAGGRVRGRLFGAPAEATLSKPRDFAATTNAPHRIDTNKPIVLSDVENESVASHTTSWMGADGIAFVKAIRGGALNHV